MERDSLWLQQRVRRFVQFRLDNAAGSGAGKRSTWLWHCGIAAKGLLPTDDRQWNASHLPAQLIERSGRDQLQRACVSALCGIVSPSCLPPSSPSSASSDGELWGQVLSTYSTVPAAPAAATIEARAPTVAEDPYKRITVRTEWLLHAERAYVRNRWWIAHATAEPVPLPTGTIAPGGRVQLQRQTVQWRRRWFAVHERDRKSVV